MSRLDKKCSVDDCSRNQTARGWCSTHYYRWKRHGDVQADKPISRTAARTSPAAFEKSSRCSIEGCENFERARGWCMAHYSRWKRHGDVQADRPLKGAVLVSTQTCSAPQCSRPTRAGGLCEPHYYRNREGIPMDTPLRSWAEPTPLGDAAPCLWGECRNAARYADLCRWHFRYSAEQAHPEVTMETLRARLGDDCHYCAVSMRFQKSFQHDPLRASVDHVVPLIAGGEHTFENTVLCCRRCNTRKRDFFLSDWLSSEIGLATPVYSEDAIAHMRELVGG